MVSPKVTAWLSGGEVGVTYTVRARVTTTLERTLDLSMKITIAQQ